eukprot:TRINITY_DN12064_c0_g1_i1.p1 TRINITY_DN12064_c0_g1~~TRINITY_DN12064_c0_g1_i1.p1  ORF type:complete len:280 (+),score=47.31 TRINITY_DN12064_c0_g1_i1:84-842(+)
MFFGLSTIKFSRVQFDPLPTLTLADVVDTFAPYPVIPLQLYLYYQCRASEIRSYLMYTTGPVYTWLVFEALLYVIFTLCWTNGHGMHLAANSVHNVLDREYFSHTIVDALKHKSTLVSLHSTIDFWDEKLGHYVWHAGIYGMQAVLVWSAPIGTTTQSFVDMVLLTVSSFIYGIMLFCAQVEGGSVSTGIPYLVFITSLILRHPWAHIKRSAILLYFGMATILTSGLLAWWGYMNGGEFPEFSDVGLLFPKQ